MTLPFNYMGLPVVANPRRISTWQPIVEKINKQLNTWKQKQLSIGGRICLIKSMCYVIPLYFLSLFKALKRMINTITCIQGNFLQGTDVNERKLTWVSWTNCCKAKDQGGSGIKDIKSFNTAFVGK